MDAKHFDRVARAIRQSTARRAVAAGLLGTVLTGSLDRVTGRAKGKSKRQRHRGTPGPRFVTEIVRGNAVSLGPEAGSSARAIVLGHTPRSLVTGISWLFTGDTATVNVQNFGFGSEIGRPEVAAYVTVARTADGDPTTVTVVAICVEGGAPNPDPDR